MRCRYGIDNKNYDSKECLECELNTCDLEVKANVMLKKWYHFKWFLNLQLRVFGRIKY